MIPFAHGVIAPREVDLTRELVDEAVRRALEEDLGLRGDITTTAVIGDSSCSNARIVVRRSGRLAGVEIAEAVFEHLDPAFEFHALARDGEDVEAGGSVAELRGSSRILLAGERVALNFLSHLSGIATATRSFVQAVEGTGAVITCTRKTTPGLRALEKYAVRCGGGQSHRFGLDSAVLVKDNHVALAGSVGDAVRRARAGLPEERIEVEVDTLEQLEEALDAGADEILLDNMLVDTLRAAVARAGGKVLLEASGGVTQETVREIAETGVDRISVGALTHSAPALDVALQIDS